MARKASTTKTTKAKATRSKKAAAAPEENTEEFSSDSIDAQVAAFLKGGGKIQEIPLGVSGQVATSGPRHITLGKRHATN